MASLAEMFLGALPQAGGLGSPLVGGQGQGFAQARGNVQLGPYGGGQGGQPWQPVPRPQTPDPQPAAPNADPQAAQQGQIEQLMEMQRIMSGMQTGRFRPGGGMNARGLMGGENKGGEGGQVQDYPDWFRQDMRKMYRGNRQDP